MNDLIPTHQQTAEGETDVTFSGSATLEQQLALQRQVAANYAAALNASNEQLSALYAEVGGNPQATPPVPPQVLSEERAAEWRVELGLPELIYLRSFKAKQMSLSAALIMLKNGRRVARAGWNGKNMWLQLQRPDEHSKMTLPYVYMCTAQGDLVPWLCSQTDLLADDWVLIHE